MYCVNEKGYNFRMVTVDLRGKETFEQRPEQRPNRNGEVSHEYMGGRTF